MAALNRAEFGALAVDIGVIFWLRSESRNRPLPEQAKTGPPEKRRNFPPSGGVSRVYAARD